MARDLYPDFYQQRLELLKKDIALISRIAALNVHGIRNAQDLKLQYAIEAGFIDMDRLENIMFPEKAHLAQDKAQRQAQFVRGLLNPNRLPRQVEKQYFRSDNAKDGTNRSNAPFAASLGIGTSGFDASGVAEEEDEDYPQFASQMSKLGFK